MSVKIFFCYAHKDEALLTELKTHLTPLWREGLIDVWYDRVISAGTKWEQQIKEQLNTAQIILLLISPDFMASDYINNVELKQALERDKKGEVRVIPVILRHAYWQIPTLRNLQALPTDAKPIKSWSDLDEAFLNVTEGIRKVVEEIATQPPPQKVQPSEQSKQALTKPTIQQEKHGQDQSSDLQALKNQFNDAMVNLYKEAAKIGYRANQFIHMVNENGGVETAHLLLVKEPTEGFTRLWEKKRLDLSVEALVLKPQYVPLFDEVERANARKRLAEYSYKAPWDI